MAKKLIGSKWDLPIAVFPAKNVIKCSDLLKLSKKSMIALEDVRSRVIACVWDGIQIKVTFSNIFRFFKRSNELKGKRRTFSPIKSAIYRKTMCQLGFLGCPTFNLHNYNNILNHIIISNYFYKF